MPKLDGRRRWRVEYPNGDVVMLKRLGTVRLYSSGQLLRDGTRSLRRLARGRYYYIETWSTPAGLMAGVVMVTRVTAPAAERELRNERLPFEPDVAIKEAFGDNHGL